MAQIDRPGGWLMQVAKEKKPDVEKLIHEAYLRTLSRPPEAGELAAVKPHIEAEKDIVTGMRDLLWALINTKEFIVVR